jgi:hypothetical protein
MFFVYHARTKATGKARRVFMDRMEILKDGTLIVHGPDTNPQPLPSGLEQGKRTASPKARSSF